MKTMLFHENLKLIFLTVIRFQLSVTASIMQRLVKSVF